MNKNNLLFIIITVILSYFTRCYCAIQYFDANTNIATRTLRDEKCPGICQQHGLTYSGTYQSNPWQCGCK